MVLRRRTRVFRRRPVFRRRRVATRNTRRSLRRRSRPYIANLRGPGQSDAVYVKLRFAESQNNISGVGSSLFNYRGVSPRDPRWATGGDSATAFATYGIQYSRYMCYGSKIKVTWISNLQNTQAWVTLVPTMGSAALADATDAKFSKNAIMTQRDGRSVVSLRHYMTTKKMFGISQNTTEQWAPITDEPPDQFYWQLYYNPLTTSPVGTFHFKIEITYYVKFFNRIDPAV